MLFYILQVVGSLLAYYYMREKRIRYFGVITFVYFFSYFFAASFDIPLTVYFIFIILGIGIPKRISFFKLFVCIWIAIYTIIGILWQETVMTFSTMIARYSYIIIYIFIMSESRSEQDWKISTDDYRFWLKFGLLTELAIVILVWMRHGIGSRVVTNNQPIGAGIVIAFTAIIGWCYLTKRFSTKEMLFYNFASLMIVLLSGTRGYMLIIGLPMLLTFILYLLDYPGKGKNMEARIGGVFVLLAVFTIVYVIFDGGTLISDLLRADQGLGYRENENYFVKAIIREAPWYHKLFGFGFGGYAQHIENFIDIVHESSWNRDYMLTKLLKRTIFHNYWYTVLFKQGIVGLFVMIGFYCTVFADIHHMKSGVWTKLLLYASIIGSIISLAFRITATCSILEFMIMACFIKWNNKRAVLKQKKMQLRT